VGGGGVGVGSEKRKSLLGLKRKEKRGGRLDYTCDLSKGDTSVRSWGTRYFSLQGRQTLKKEYGKARMSIESLQRTRAVKKILLISIKEVCRVV